MNAEDWLKSVGQVLDAINEFAEHGGQPILVMDVNDIHYIIKWVEIDRDGRVVLHLKES